MANPEVKARRSQKEIFGSPLSKGGRYNRLIVRMALLKAYQRKVFELAVNGTEKFKGKTP